MADAPLISLELPSLGDILTNILPSPSDESTPITIISSIVGPTVTVTASGSSGSTSGTSGSTSASNTTSHTSTASSNSTSISNTTSNTSTPTGDFITTTYLTYDGDTLVTITAIVSNPAAHVHSNSGHNNAFLSNRTAVIGVFTAIAIVVFALIAAVIAWAARRRTLKRRKREEEERSSRTRRNFFDDEDNDVIAPSEKSWWGNASGVSMPDTALTHHQPVPPVPPLPAEYSPSAPTFTASDASSAPLVVSPTRVVSPTSGASVAHPYASAAPSIMSELYDESHGHHHTSSFATATSTSRDTLRSPPPLVTSPNHGYKSQGQPVASMLPLIVEGSPPSASSDDWNSNIQYIHRGPPSQSPTSGVTSRDSPSPQGLLNTGQNSTQPSANSKESDHPYASPRTNRRSELLVDDVLMNIGKNLAGGLPAESLGHSSRSNHSHQHQHQQTQEHQQQHRSSQQNQPVRRPSTATAPATRPPQTALPRPPLSRLNSSSGTMTGTSGSIVRDRSGTALSEARWFDENSSSEAARTRGGAAASGESVLEGRDNGLRRNLSNQNRSTHQVTSEIRVNGASSKWVSTTNESVSVDVSERKRVPHDPRFSGLFGNVWGASNDESQTQTQNQRHTAYTVRPSTDIDLDSNGHDHDEQEYEEVEEQGQGQGYRYGSRALRVTNG